jgi:hypothetical protein
MKFPLNSIVGKSNSNLGTVGWKKWSKRIAGMLAVCKENTEVNRVVVGVDSSFQLQEILAAWNTEAITVPDTLKINDKELS